MKLFVKVVADFEFDGSLTPNTVFLENGQAFHIDKITDIRWLASSRSGKPKIRYACLMHGRQQYLYYENNRWYLPVPSSVKNRSSSF